MLALPQWMQKWITPRDNLPRDLTTADWLKAMAVVLMVIDHVGYYLFPESLWFRVIGRPGMPVWFFLVGYARVQDLPPRWLYAGLILLFANLIVLMPPFPLSALFTLALCRLLVVPFWRWAERHAIYFWWAVLLLLFVGPVTDKLVEYGTFGFLIATVGYAIRNRDRISGAFTRDPTQPLFTLVIVVFCIYEVMQFMFDPLQSAVMTAGMLGTYFVLLSYENKSLPGTVNHPHAALLRFMGRYTLEIYVIHLLILKAVFGLERLATSLVG